jgi:hypothetical protein
MGRTPSIIDGVVFTVRLPSSDANWLAREGKAVGNTAIAVRRMVDDARNFYGMPEPFRETLAEDAKKRGKTQREYIVELLARRCEELMREKIKSAR